MGRGWGEFSLVQSVAEKEKETRETLSPAGMNNSVRARIVGRAHVACTCASVRPRAPSAHIYIYIYVGQAQGVPGMKLSSRRSFLLTTSNLYLHTKYSKFFLRVLRSSISNFSFFFPFFLQFYHSTRHFTTKKIKILDFYLEKLYLASSYRSFNLQNAPLPRCPSPLLFALIGRGNTTSFNRHIPFLPKRCSFCFVFDSREN